jgi:hypothetical protein
MEGAELLREAEGLAEQLKGRPPLEMVLRYVVVLSNMIVLPHCELFWRGTRFLLVPNENFCYS